MTTEKFKKDKPDIDVFDSDTNKVEVPTGPLQSTMQTADERERRHLSSLKPANAESPSVFDQSDASDLHRLSHDHHLVLTTILRQIAHSRSHTRRPIPLLCSGN